LSDFVRGRNRLNCLSFGRDVRRSEPTAPGPDTPHWLLAACDSGGTVTVWDLARRQIGSYPMFGVADPFAGVTRAGIWLVFRGFLGDPRVLS